MLSEKTVRYVLRPKNDIVFAVCFGTVTLDQMFETVSSRLEQAWSEKKNTFFFMDIAGNLERVR